MRIQADTLPQKRWVLDRHIPIAVIIAIILQTVAAVWWTAKLESRVEVLEIYMAQHKQDADRLIRIEERLQYLSERLGEFNGRFRK